MGIVYEAVHRHLGRHVAIKQLPRAFGADPVVRRRFLSEAKLLATLEHPHIVPIYDYVEREGLCLLVMELLDGGSVWTRFESGQLRPETACSIGAVSAVALHRAHQHGVLHRDVKPENVLFGGNGMLKVTDFGIAKVRDATSSLATRAGEVLGTPAYMAPEQAQGVALGPPTDIYSLGVMLYELLAGRLPFPDDLEPMALLFKHVFEAPPMLGEVADVSPPIADVVMRALAKAPEDRYDTAEHFGVASVGAGTATWGPGWMARSDVVLIGGGPVGAAADRPAVPLTLTTLHAQREAAAREADAVSPGAAAVGSTPRPERPVTLAPQPVPPDGQPLRDPTPTLVQGPARAQEPRTAVLDGLPALIDDLRAAGQDDLAERVAGALAVARSVGGTVWVTGGYKAGKSSLVNALVADTVCPVDDDAPTTVLTVVRAGSPRARVRRQRGPARPGSRGRAR